MKTGMLLLLLLVTLELGAQGKGTPRQTDRLLWYTGKKIDDTTLLTKWGATVVLHRSANEVEVKIPDKKDPFAPMIRRLRNTDSLRKAMWKFLASRRTAPVSYPLAQAAADALDQVDRDFAPVLNNRISLSGGSSGAFAHPPSLYGNAGPRAPETPEELPADTGKISCDFSKLTPPPAWVSDMCVTKEKEKEYHEASDAYWEKYLGPLSRQISRQLEKMRRQPQDEAQGANQATEEVDDNANCFKRFFNALQAQYGNDLRYSRYIITLTLSLERQRQLLGCSTEEEVRQELADVGNTLNHYERSFRDALDKGDLKMIFDWRTFISNERAQMLLGRGEATPDEWQAVLTRLLGLRIRLDVEVYVEKDENSDGSIQRARLGGTRLYRPFYDYEDNKLYLFNDSGNLVHQDDRRFMDWKLIQQAYSYHDCTTDAPAQGKFVSTAIYNQEPSIALDLCAGTGSMAMDFDFQGENEPHWITNCGTNESRVSLSGFMRSGFETTEATDVINAEVLTTLTDIRPDPVIDPDIQTAWREIYRQAKEIRSQLLLRKLKRDFPIRTEGTWIVSNETIHAPDGHADDVKNAWMKISMKLVDTGKP